MGFFDFFSSKKDKQSLDKGIEKTKTSLFSKIGKAIVGKDTVDEEILDELEATLIAADVGIDTTIKIIENIESRVARDKYVNTNDLNKILRDEIQHILSKKNESTELIPNTNGLPYVMLVVGVNGVGKTTTIGKLAHMFKKHGKKVILGAADTFRAAAVDQIELWGDRVGVPVVSHGMEADPASVAFDAVKQAVNDKADIVIIDTAGRLHNKVGLMNELAKVKRVIQKFIPEAPHDIMLVLDGSTGQNAFLQTQEFTNATDVTCLSITKLDGTAKGGVVIGISAKFDIPIKYIGLGEGINDIQVFNKKDFVDSLFS